MKCCDAAGNVMVGDDGPGGAFRSLDDATYVFVDPGDEAVGRQAFGPVTVPKGRLWVMGDHRDESADSRYHCGAEPVPGRTACADGAAATATSSTVPVDLVIGKAVAIAWPVSRWTTLGTPSTFTATAPRADGPAVPVRPAVPSGVVLGVVLTGVYRRR